MKLIMMVLTIRFIAELISNKLKNTKGGDRNKGDDITRHPAEWDLR